MVYNGKNPKGWERLFANTVIVLTVITAVLILLTNTASALTYEDKPNVTAYIVGSNHLTRGNYEILNVVVYNPAERKKVDYAYEEESMFFSGRENMLFTAYNVELKLEGNGYVEVKTPEQKIPALPPFKPVRLQFVVKVDDDAKTGEYLLKLRVKFDRIDGLEYLDTYPPQEVPVQKVVSGTNETLTEEYRVLTEAYKIRYKEVSFEIPLTVYVEEKNVRLEIANVTAENMMGRAKGRVIVWVKNVGDKTGRNAYLILETPPGFTTSTPQNDMATPVPMQIPSAMPSTTPALATIKPTAVQPTVTASVSQPTYYIGDFKPGEVAKAVFYVKVNVREEGNYTFKVRAVYLNEYNQTEYSNEVPFGVHVAKAPDFKVKSVQSKVYVNTKGDVIVKIVPTVDLKDVSVYISTSPPLSVLSAKYYLGDVRAGEEYTAVFKIQASNDAKPVTYPAEIRLKYRSLDEYFESDPIEIGIKVNPKMRLEVYGTPKIQAGSEAVVEWTVKNVGNFTIREATARLTIVDPFSSSDDTAYIGTLKPGETAVVKFKLKVDRDATPKLYGLNLEVKYKDPEDEWAVSEPVKAVVEVTPAKAPYGLIPLLIFSAVVVGFLAWRRRKK